jgi:hypothetical protein
MEVLGARRAVLRLQSQLGAVTRDRADACDRRHDAHEESYDGYQQARCRDRLSRTHDDNLAYTRPSRRFGRAAPRPGQPPRSRASADDRATRFCGSSLA